MDLNKKFNIKINSIKRLNKENNYYDNFIFKTKQNIETMENNNTNIYDIKYHKEILRETILVKQTTINLIKQYTTDLKELVNEHLEDGNIDSEIIEQINSIE